MRVSIQGELGSNSHMAAKAMLPHASVIACAVSREALDRVLSGEVDGAVLPIENTLHGSVMEHYDLLLQLPVSLAAEFRLHITHALLALPGTATGAIHRVLSHPVALSQCRRWLAAHPEIVATPFYDTAGSLKHIVEAQLGDTAAIAPPLAAEVYGGVVLAEGLEDHEDNFTRFHLVVPEVEKGRSLPNIAGAAHAPPDKMTLAFAVEHKPASLVRALDAMAQAGADLTRIESRPVHGRPWEYIFYVDLRFPDPASADLIVQSVQHCCGMVKELGRYGAAR